jgi:hypothetical protein
MTEGATKGSAQTQDGALEEASVEFSTVILRLTRRQLQRERAGAQVGEEAVEPWPEGQRHDTDHPVARVAGDPRRHSCRAAGPSALGVSCGSVYRRCGR